MPEAGPVHIGGFIAFALAIFAAGGVLIRLLRLNLPVSRSLPEFLRRVFWIYAPDIDRGLVLRNRIAWFVVVVVAYLLATAIFF